MKLVNGCIQLSRTPTIMLTSEEFPAKQADSGEILKRFTAINNYTIGEEVRAEFISAGESEMTLSMTTKHILIVIIITACLVAASAFAAAPKPLKVFILAGQSNMDGQANVSTIDFLGEDKEHGYLLQKFKPDGKTLVTQDDVWVAHRGVYGKLGPGYGGRKSDDKLGSNIGPECAFGYFMGEAMAEQVLLIKYAVGGQSLYQNFRPPSAGLPSPLPPKTKAEDFGGATWTVLLDNRSNSIEHIALGAGSGKRGDAPYTVYCSGKIGKAPLGACSVPPMPVRVGNVSPIAHAAPWRRPVRWQRGGTSLAWSAWPTADRDSCMESQKTR